jgi:hypothetical protein
MYRARTAYEKIITARMNHGLLDDPADVEGGGPEVGEHNGSRSPERDKGKEYGGRDDYADASVSG